MPRNRHLSLKTYQPPNPSEVTMAELHSNIYYKHDNPATMPALDTLFLETRGDAAQIRSVAASLNPRGSVGFPILGAHHPISHTFTWPARLPR